MSDRSRSNPSKRVLVLAVSYGEPPVSRLWDQVRYSYQILRRLALKVAPIPKPLLPLIAFHRGWQRKQLWRYENYQSPLELITQQQAVSLSRALEGRGAGTVFEVRAVFEFREPFLEGALREVAASRPDRLLILPLYAWDCDFTTGLVADAVAAHEARHGKLSPQPEYVSRFSEDDRLVELMARFVIEQLDAEGWDDSDYASTGLLLGAHGTVLDGPQGVDTGLDVSQSLYERLAGRLEPEFAQVSVGWLNHTRGGEWTSPDLASAAADLTRRGVRRAAYFPFGFLADNAETQLEARCVLRKVRELSVQYVPSLNQWPAFVQYLADRVAAAGGPDDARD